MTFVVATFALSWSGMAAELPKSGHVEGRYYLHNVQKIDELQTADGMKAYTNEAFEFHVGKQQGGLLDGTTGRCLGYGRYSDSGAVMEIGRCAGWSVGQAAEQRDHQFQSSQTDPRPRDAKNDQALDRAARMVDWPARH
jgi:hypothetical protein